MRDSVKLYSTAVTCTWGTDGAGVPGVSPGAGAGWVGVLGPPPAVERAWEGGRRRLIGPIRAGRAAGDRGGCDAAGGGCADDVCSASCGAHGGARATARRSGARVARGSDARSCAGGRGERDRAGGERARDGSGEHGESPPRAGHQTISLGTVP